MRLAAVLALAWLLPALAQAATLQVEGGDSRLRELLGTQLDLARALERAERDPDLPLDAAERARLCELAPEQARELLQTEGYFSPQRLHMDCEALRFTLDPGAQAVVQRLHINAVLGVDEDEEGERLPGRWRRALGLREGDGFTQPAWNAGKRALLARVRADGHPLARYALSDAAVDVATASVELRLHLVLGPAVKIGTLTLSGFKHHDEAKARSLLALHSGDAYTEQGLLDAQDRLLKSGLFDSVQVELDPESLDGDRMAVRVRVVESPLQQLGLGLGWQSGSGASGERITLEHLHRRFLGRPLRSSFKMLLARDAQSASLELSTHPEARLRRNLIGLAWEREQGAEVAAYRQAALRLGQVFESRPHDRAISLELLSSRQGLGELATQADALLGHVNPTWRTVDSVLLPRQGQALQLQLGAGQARSSSLESGEQRGGVGRLHARWLGYWPMQRGRLIATRVEAGQIWAKDALRLPESLLWRAGGDESVRGYGRRSLGPEEEGQAVGGRVVWSASAEWQAPLPRDWTFGLDGIGYAAFLDAGQAARQWKEAKPALGGGLGLRWRSPVGLLRVDLARGQEKYGGGWRLHFSLGLSL